MEFFDGWWLVVELVGCLIMVPFVDGGQLGPPGLGLDDAAHLAACIVSGYVMRAAAHDARRFALTYVAHCGSGMVIQPMFAAQGDKLCFCQHFQTPECPDRSDDTHEFDRQKNPLPMRLTQGRLTVYLVC